MNLRRRLALSYYQARGGFPASFGGVRYRLLPQDRKFWRKMAAGRWEAHTFAALQRCLRADSVYLDVGAWIGPTVLYAAARCRAVYCVEPDPCAYEHLLANLRLNRIDNVRPFHGALGAGGGVVEIASQRGFGDSLTRVRRVADDDAAAAERAWVLAVTLPGLLDWWGIDRLDVVKMDVEGAEFELMPAFMALLARMKPVIHLSLHAPFFAPAERRDKLGGVAELAAQYAFCYDEGLNLIAPKQITGDEFAERFRALTLSDVALV